jgi:hypothetical protein
MVLGERNPMTEDNFACRIAADHHVRQHARPLRMLAVGISQDMVQRRKGNRAHGCFDWAISAIRPMAKIG